MYPNFGYYHISLVESEFNDQKKLGHDLEDWLNPREGQYTHSLFMSIRNKSKHG